MSDTSTLPRSKNDLTAKERHFFDSMVGRIPPPEDYVRIRNVTFRFRAPLGFTQGEFDRVGHVLTMMAWDWEELGHEGEPRWSYILDPGV